MSENGIGGWGVEGIKADLTNSTFDKDGNLTLTFTIDRGSKWEIAPITDIRGRAFELDVRTQGKRVFLAPGALEAARLRRLEAEGADDGD